MPDVDERADMTLPEHDKVINPTPVNVVGPNPIPVQTVIAASDRPLISQRTRDGVLVIAGIIYLVLQIYSNHQSSETAKRAEEVRETLATSNTQTNEKLDIIHALGNSNLLEAKRAVAIGKQAVANLTHEPDDVLEAQRAMDVVKRMEAEQQIINEAINKRVRSAPPFPATTTTKP